MPNKQIEKLIKAGGELIEKAREYSIKNHEKGDIYIMLDFILSDYRNWKDSVVKLLEQNKINEITICNITSSDTLFINPNQWAKKAIDPKTKTKAIKLFIENVNRIIKQLLIIHSPQTNKNVDPLTPINKNSNKIKITISEKGIFRIKDGKELIYQIKQGGKRAKLVYYLLNSNKPLPGKELMEKIDYTEKELLGKEIGEINKSFISRLNFNKLNENFLILNHQTGDGYFLNTEKYFFE